MPWRHALVFALAGLPVILVGLSLGYFLLIWMGASFVVVPLGQCLLQRLEGPARAYLHDRRISPARVSALPEEALTLAADLCGIKTSIAPEDIESGTDLGLMDLLTAAGWMSRWSYEDELRWRAHPDLALLIAREYERRELELLQPGPRLGPRSRPSVFAERAL